MKPYLCLVFFSLISFSIMAQPSHQSWNELLKAHVAVNGSVDYEGFMKDQSKLDTYLTSLSEAKSPESWSEKEQLAYWINVYNAFTVKAIINHYPLKSIMDIKPASGAENIWKDNFFKIGGKKYSLNAVEHEVLRKKFDEPRIHFAINCASASCPDLRNEAFVASKLEQQLEEQTSRFINDQTKNKIGDKKLQLSALFDWFKGDFTKQGTLIEFLDKYTSQNLGKKLNISYLKYDWSLND